MWSKDTLDAVDQVTLLRKECLKLVEDTLAMVSPNPNGDYPDTFRYVVTPFLYAVWERCFTTSFGVMAKLISLESSSASELSTPQAALWLQSEPFYVSYVQLIKNASNIDPSNARKRVRASSYNALEQFLSQMFTWQGSPMNKSIDTSELVMTFSNVNLDVVDINARAIGLSAMSDYATFRSNAARLDDFVGKRNDIGHGTLKSPPGNREFRQLTALAKDVLINEYCDLVQTWLLFR